MSFVLLLFIASIGLNEHPQDAQGNDFKAGVIYAGTVDGEHQLTYPTLDECKAKMVEVARDLHEQAPLTKFVVRCQPAPFYDGESV